MDRRNATYHRKALAISFLLSKQWQKYCTKKCYNKQLPKPLEISAHSSVPAAPMFAATQLQSGPFTRTSCKRGARRASEKRQFVKICASRVAAPRRNAGRSVAAKSNYHHPRTHPLQKVLQPRNKNDSRESPPVVHRAQPSALAAASETGVCRPIYSIGHRLPPRTDTTRAVEMTARVH